MPPKKAKSIEEKYKKHEHDEHILSAPDMYIGPIDKTTEEMWIYDTEDKIMVKKNIEFIPGLYKIFDEILVNAIDQDTRLKSELANGNDDIKLLKN